MTNEMYKKNVRYKFEEGISELPLWTCDNEGCGNQIYEDTGFATIFDYTNSSIRVECLRCTGRKNSFRNKDLSGFAA